MFFSIIFLVVGLVLLVYGADSLVRGASSVAKKVGLSDLFIGLTVVAFGTSLPELTANIFATLRGSFDIAVGNIVGSNIANILLVLGVAAVIYPLAVHKSTVSRQIPYNLLAIFVLFILANDTLLIASPQSLISRVDGLIMIIMFGIFLYYTFINSRVSGGDQEDIKVKRYSYATSLGLVIGGIVMLTLGGRWVVDGAVAIAEIFGISQALIGLTIIAVGTSLPELFTSAIAAFKKNSDIAIGNIIGSNIFNIFWVLGVSSLIRPLVFSTLLNYDILIFAGASTILLLFMFVGKRNVLQRWQGAVLIILYVIYIIYLILRG